MPVPALRQLPGHRVLWLRLVALCARGLAPSFQPVMAGVAPRFGDLLRVRLGDELARQQFLEYFWPGVQDEVRRYVRRGGPEDELLAEGALALWEAACQYDPRRHRTDLPAYVQNQVHRRVRRAYRKAMGYDQVKVVPLDEMERFPAHDNRLEEVESRLDLERAQAQLPPGDREALTQYLDLARRAGLGPDQAARRLAQEKGGTQDAWKKRLQRTRNKLRPLLIVTDR